jgi:4-aminobutyrate aminotransferase
MLEACRENRTLIGKGGLSGNVLRISPPMNIGKSDVDSFVERLDASFKKVTAARTATVAR